MTNTDREARLEQIRERMEVRYSFPEGRTVALSDMGWLLSEIDRLRKIEEAAREVRHTDTEPCTCGESPYKPCSYCDPFDRLNAKLEGEEDE